MMGQTRIQLEEINTGTIVAYSPQHGKPPWSCPASLIMLLDDSEQRRSSHSLLQSRRRPYDWHSRRLLTEDAG